MEKPSNEEVARHYSAMMDSVNLINILVPTTVQKDLDTLDRNVRHLELMLERNWWDGYDLTPINTAIVTGKQ